MTVTPAPAKPEGNGALVFGLVVGSLAGAVIGLWRAPMSGAELRGRLLRRSQAIGEKAESIVAGERVEDAIAEGKALAQQRRAELG